MMNLTEVPRPFGSSLRLLLTGVSSEMSDLEPYLSIAVVCLLSLLGTFASTV